MTASPTRGRRAALLLLASLALFGTATSCSKSDGSDGTVVEEDSVEYESLIEIHEEDAKASTTTSSTSSTTSTTKPATTTTTKPTTTTTKPNTPTTTKPNTTTTTAAPTTTTTSTPATTTTTTTPAEPVLGKIQSATSLEDNGAPIDPTDTFDADTPVIYSTVLASTLPAGTEIEATWTLSGKTISTAKATAKTSQTDVYVHFELDAKGDFATGTYTLQLTVNGEKGPKTTFTVS